jgi:hypothetical protein
MAHSRTVRFTLAACCFSAIAVILHAQQPADTVLLHGKVYTENAAQPWAEAVAIKDGRIEAVGSTAEIARYRGAATQVIDAEGRLVLPGFVDSHVHFIGGSLALDTVALDSAETVAEIQKRVKEFAEAHPQAKVVTGYGWMYPVFGKAALPDKKFLDAVVPDRPVVLTAYDEHTTWANSKALALAGITKDTPNPLNGTIVRDPATGEATGALKEAAGRLVSALEPEKTDEEMISAVVTGMKLANSFGITRVDSAGGDGEHIEVFDQIRKRNLLTLRFYFSVFAQPPVVTPEFIEKVEALRRNYHDEWLSGGAIKFWADGVIEAHTAAMLAPYSDDPTASGHLNWTPENYRAGVLEFDRRGFQIFTHAIGDQTIRMALDTYAEANAVNHRPDARPRIEHIEDPDAADIPRFGKLHVIASMQPLHAYPNSDVLDIWARNVGPARAQHAWPWNDLESSGARLAFGSDWPVVTLDPWKAIQTLLTRETLEGTPPGGWLPGQRITLKQAIDGYTLDGAFAAFREKTEGSIETGKLADLIVVSQNLFEIPVKQIHNTKVLYTLVGGKIVYQAPR